MFPLYHLLGLLTILGFSAAAPTNLTRRGSLKAGISWPIQEGSADPVEAFFQGGSQLVWWYDWNKNWNTLLSSSPGLFINAQFLPCIFLPSYSKNGVSLQPGATDILGYNEPDLNGVSVADAAQDWIANVVPLRKGTLWSPAVSNSDGGRAWLVAFFQAICPGYSGSNGYAGCPNAPNGVSANIYAKTYSDFVKWTTYYWKTHGLPLNIKEFTAEDFSGSPPLSQQGVYDFMGQTTKFLDETPWVAKYAWFGAVRNPAFLYGVASVNRLMNDDGSITPLGQQYIRGGHT